MKVNINESDIRKMVSESFKRVLSESTFFPGNDPQFPKEIAKSIKSFADMHGVEFEYKGDYVQVRTRFKDDLMWYSASELYGVKMNEDGTLNYWICSISPRGRQNYNGPGYSIYDQKPISPDSFLNMVEKNIEQLARYGK